MTKRIPITYRALRQVAFTYLMLPTLLFLAFFLKPGYAAVSAALLLGVWGWTCFGKKDKGHLRDKPVYCALYEFLIVAAVVLLWAYLGGQGGFFYQTTDWNERNAIFRDLIRYDWPVYYTRTRTVLTYYVGHWLPAALIGKIVYRSTYSLDAAWRAGNVMLMLWSSLGLGVMAFLLFKAVQANTLGKRAIALLVLLFFSGLDVIGCINKGWKWEDFMLHLHLEWWAFRAGYQFSSITTCLFWVFNQAIPLWIATLCFVNENKGGVHAKNYGFIAVTALMCGPLPDVGLVLLMLYAMIYAAVEHFRAKKIKEWLRDVFSLGNVVMAAGIFPFIGLYMMANMAVGSTPAAKKPPQFSSLVFVFIGLAVASVVLICLLKNAEWRKACLFMLVNFTILGAMLFIKADYKEDYVLFLLLEAGIYLILLFPYAKGNYLYHACALLLAIAPLFKVGNGADFCMRMSIPLVLILAVLCIRFLFNQSVFRRENAMVIFVCKVLLVSVLIVGACTPAMEFYRGFADTENIGTADQIFTLNKRHSSGGLYGNFVSADWENSFFFTHLSSLKH